MAPQKEVIDLSLSTDEESLMEKGKRKEKEKEKGKEKEKEKEKEKKKEKEKEMEKEMEKRRFEDGFLVLGDEDDYDWLMSDARKRRRLGSEEDLERKLSYRETSRRMDPFIFGSSPHNEAPAFDMASKDPQPLSLLSDESDDSLPEDIFQSSLRHSKQGSGISERTMALLARLERPRKSKGRTRVSGEADRATVSTGSEADSTLVKKKKMTVKTGKNKRMKLTEEERAAKAKERETLKEANRAQKEKEREAEREKKRILKEKAKEKKIALALADVNRAKMDKKRTGPEMIVDIPSNIHGQDLDLQIRAFLKNLGIEAATFQAPRPNIIKWRRKVTYRWNQETEQRDLVSPMEIENEKHILCLLPANEFVALAAADAHSTNIETHVQDLKREFAGCKLIYLIEGLHTWTRKNKLMLNRAYQAAVLSQIPAQDKGNHAFGKPHPRRKKPAHEYVDNDKIEDGLLRLQVHHNALIHHTATAVETAEWVTNFTQHISTIPFRYLSLFASPFKKSFSLSPANEP